LLALLGVTDKIDCFASAVEKRLDCSAGTAEKKSDCFPGATEKIGLLCWHH